ncbi:hypothetical protein EXIGLDRAFT_838987 [Exidia glandulosa HHB12029]|uniref:Uncharacterized protein n=1 Tax=Exidia glandulosa HHB12029 TaxID=1314781 RepID=A0A165FBG0_EXIGL|nr:hypothetical protein EXIGLDRAFT_838987 [Exidia glandulosa HHB12029]
MNTSVLSALAGTVQSPTLRRFDARRDTVDVGQIIVVLCSVKEPILKAMKAYHAIAPPTASMVSFRQRLADDDINLKPRPCLVVRSTRDDFMIVPFATFEDSLITDLDLHTQHFAVAVGHTPAWPAGRETLPVSPYWPESRLRPVYALAKEIPLHNRLFGGLYQHWERDARGNLLADVNGDVVTRSDFEVDDLEIRKFRQLIQRIQRQYEKLTPGQRAVYNKSWEEAEQRRKQAQADTTRSQAGSSRPTHHDPTHLSDNDAKPDQERGAAPPPHKLRVVQPRAMPLRAECRAKEAGLQS